MAATPAAQFSWVSTILISIQPDTIIRYFRKTSPAPFPSILRLRLSTSVKLSIENGWTRHGYLRIPTAAIAPKHAASAVADELGAKLTVY